MGFLGSYVLMMHSLRPNLTNKKHKLVVPKHCLKLMCNMLCRESRHVFTSRKFASKRDVWTGEDGPRMKFSLICSGRNLQVRRITQIVHHVIYSLSLNEYKVGADVIIFQSFSLTRRDKVQFNFFFLLWKERLNVSLTTYTDPTR